MKLSIVTTLYNSQAHLEAFHQAMTEAAQKVTGDYEIIMVNDGSPDQSLATALRLQKKDAHIKIIDLSRNFGELTARMIGFGYATGDFVYLIQCDLEVSPRYLQEFWDTLHASDDVDMVYGVQKKRRGAWRERMGGAFFYTFFNLFSEVRIARNDAACRLMTRRFVNALLEHHERTIFFAGLCVITGFGQKMLAIEKTRSNKGSYSLARKISMTIDALTSFSILPLLIVFYAGMGILLLSIIYTAVIITNKLFFSISVDGWTSLIVSLWFLGGCIIAAVGLLGIYISRIFIEVKQRPYAIVKHIYSDAKAA